MTNAIAQASIASTNLLNGLQLINRETGRVSENQEVVRRFEACKQLRRRVLYYIQHVESDQWIGSLVNANDELVKALTAYDLTDRSIDNDSDSDWEQSNSIAQKRQSGSSAEAQQQLSGLSLNEAPPSKPSRPDRMAMPPPSSFAKPSPSQRAEAEGEDDEEDDDNPFGDGNAVSTPRQERPGMTWKEV